MKAGVIFDMDGTLLDTLEDLTDSVNVALEQNGHRKRTLEEMRLYVGNDAGSMLRKAAPEGADLKPIMDAFIRWYGFHCQDKTHPYEGIMEALEQLKAKYPVAVVSNKPDFAVKKICKYVFPGIEGIGEIKGVPRKPAPDMVHAAMKQLGADKCVYIGDSGVDLLTARNSGLPCISVLWGYRTREELEAEGATRFCAHPSQLPAMVDEVLASL